MLNEATFCDAFNLLCGEKIGEGIHRKVYECKIRSDLVVKVEDQDYRYFANVMEEKFWDDNQYFKKVSVWLAPCEFLSPDGRILLQKRCDPVTKKFKIPKQLPSFLTDIKLKNFGVYEGRFVCLDYAMTIQNPNVRLQKVSF